MSRLAPILAAGALALVSAAEAAPFAFVGCAPGTYSAEAKPAIVALAAAVASAAGLERGAIAAAHVDTEAAGVARLQQPDAGLALVALPFYLLHRQDLDLVPHLQAVPREGIGEVWRLVAAKGRIHAAADLAGWQLMSLASYAPRFVRGVALGRWGAPPATTRLVPAVSVMSGLRRAAATENVALLLDSTQVQGLPPLPFVDQLEIVATSGPLPGTLLCSIGDRLSDARLRPLLAALAKIEGRPGGAAALAKLRLARLAPLDSAALSAVERAYDAVP